MKLSNFFRKLRLPGKKLAKDYIRCPHCTTLYALYVNVNWENLTAVQCGTCTLPFNGIENKSKPRGKIKLPKKINPFQPRLSRLKAKAPAQATPSVESIEFKPELKPEAAILAPKLTEANPAESLHEERFAELLGGQEISPVVPGEHFEEPSEVIFDKIEVDPGLEDFLATLLSDQPVVAQPDPIESKAPSLFTSPSQGEVDTRSVAGERDQKVPTLQKSSKKSVSLGWLAASLGLLISINLLLGSLAWLNREALTQNNTLRPWLIAACNTLNCTLPAYHDPAQWVVQQHQLTHDSHNPTHFELHALIQNTGLYPQTLANLQMNVDNLQGEQVKSLTFAPLQYAESHAHKLVTPGETLHIKIRITDKMPDIFSYELKFF
jgi:hypothetical protein